VHELGHVFGLGDEYSTAMREHAGAGLWTTLMAQVPLVLRLLEALRLFRLYPNVTFNPRRPPWHLWLGADDGVSTFEGALLMPTGAFRPAPRCKMARERDDFCAICREAIIRRIYRVACPARLTVARVDDQHRYQLTLADGLPLVKWQWHVRGTRRPDLSRVRSAVFPDPPRDVAVDVVDETPWIRGTRPRFRVYAKISEGTTGARWRTRRGPTRVESTR